MEVQALTRYAHMSPKKMREVARTIQGRKAPAAVEYLPAHPAQVRPPDRQDAAERHRQRREQQQPLRRLRSWSKARHRKRPGPQALQGRRPRHRDAPPQENVPHPHRPVGRRQQLIYPPWAKRPIRSASVSPSAATGSPAGLRPRRNSASSCTRTRSSATMLMEKLKQASVPRIFIERASNRVPRQDLHRAPGHRHRPQGPGGRERSSCSWPSSPAGRSSWTSRR